MDLPELEPHRAAATTPPAITGRLRALVVLCVLSLAALTYVEALPAGGPVDVLVGTLIWVPAIAGMVALTVARRRLIASECSASSDPLTGLLNHRAFHEQLDREVSRAARRGECAALLLIDVDGFKSVNDLSGHRAGDRVLREIAAAIRHGTRDVDMAGRIGGDELAVIAPASGAREATELAGRLVRAVRSVRVGELDASAHMTVSIGCSVYPDLATSRTELFESADAALYLAKQRGRDQYALATPGEEPDVPEVELDRVRAQLAASRADFRALFEHALDALLITDGVTILDVNAAAVRMAGTARERLLGRRLTAFATIGGEESLARLIDAAVESGRGSGETPLVLSDGRQATVEFAAARFSPDRYVLEIRNVTERLRQQAATAASEAAFRAIFEHDADGLFVVDDDGVVVDANLAACRLVDRSRPELIGTRADSLVGPGDTATSDELRADGVRVASYESVGPGGAPRRFEAVIVADVAPGRSLASVREVTGRDSADAGTRTAAPAVVR